MTLLSQKTVLVISPQPWNHIPISKHNYAIELSRRGCTVFFLEPPRVGLDRRVSVSPVAEYPGISVVSYVLGIPLFLRFHARPVYDRLMRHEIRRVTAALEKPLDVVWSFEFNLYMNLRAFGAPLTIYHVADPISLPDHVAVGRSADGIFTVSRSILNKFAGLDRPAWVIGHGLAEPFAREAATVSATSRDANARKAVGYAGNLVHPAIDHRVIKSCIVANPDVDFHFWGPTVSPFLAGEPNVAEIKDFLAFLSSRDNVRLHGEISQAELAEALGKMDCLILAYRTLPDGYDLSNSHKVLEYLSTGVVTVATRLLEYESRGELLRMTEEQDEASFVNLLRETLDDLEQYNAPELCDRRRAFALGNTYARKIDRVEECLD